MMKKWHNGKYIEMTSEEIENLSGGVGTTNPDENEKEIYPQKVFEYEWKDNYDVIDVVSIDYDTGALKVSSMPLQITDDVTTTVRVFPSVKIEGYQTPFKYGKMPNEIMSTAGYYYAKKVGDNQITLCNPTTSEELSTITNSNVVDLTRWNLYVEKKRKSAIPGVSVTNLDKTHKYKALFYIPNSAHYCSGINFVSENNDKYGSGYGTGYQSLSPKAQEMSGNINLFGVNNYETISFRGMYYSYSANVMTRFPRIIEAELKHINDQVAIVKSDVAYFSPSSALKDSTTFNFINAKNTIYLQTPVEKIGFGTGNENYLLDGAKCEVWDLGEIE